MVPLIACAALLLLGCGIAATIFVGVGAATNGGGGGGGTNQSARFTVTTGVDLLQSEVVGSSPNIVGPPQIAPIGPDEYQITVELSDVPDGEEVHLTLKVASPTVPDGELHVKSVAFYPVPPSQLPPVTQPPAELGPAFLWRMDTALGMVLDVLNPNTSPMSLALDGAESTVLISGSQVYYGGTTGLSWQPLANTTVGPQQVLTVDLPDNAADEPTPKALLLRYVSTVLSCEQRGVCQIEMSGPIGTEVSTWGGIKALYR
jgi:hypothetical protein